MRKLYHNEIVKHLKNNRDLANNWGLLSNERGELMVDGNSCVHLAEQYGTPLHVIHEGRLKRTAQDFHDEFANTYPGKVSIHYAFKCNSVPAIIRIIKQCGLKAEVVTEYELRLALNEHFQGGDIIVNGPVKTDNLLKMCLEANIRLIIIDSIQELDRLMILCKQMDKKANILLRINPDFVPHGMNQGSATGSRKGCAFGLDLKSDEIYRALDKIDICHYINFQGFHFHIGSGITRPDDYRKALMKLDHVIVNIISRGHVVQIFDIGGGFATPASREMTNTEMLLYQGWGKLPGQKHTVTQYSFTDFATAISEGINSLFKRTHLPELIVEPGRCIVSSNQMLLLGIHQIKERFRIRKWVITDGGIGTVTMPTFYEYHEILLCNDLNRPCAEYVTITGPACFAADVVYRNKKMPVLNCGEILAIMDSGAYFTAWESSFGFPRSAIISVFNGQHRLVRRRETFEEMIARDNIIYS